MQDLGMVDRLPRLVAAQAAKANPFYLSYLKVSGKSESGYASRPGRPPSRLGPSLRKGSEAIQRPRIVEQVDEHEMAAPLHMADATQYTCLIPEPLWPR